VINWHYGRDLRALMLTALGCLLAAFVLFVAGVLGGWIGNTYVLLSSVPIMIPAVWDTFRSFAL
jgi:hypothetical protein